MRLALASCLVVLASAAGAAAQPAPQQAPQGSLPAHKAEYNINTFGDLVQLCGTTRNDQYYVAKVSLCAGYISGVLDYHLVDTGWSASRRYRRVCLPANPPDRLEALQSLVVWDQSHSQFDADPAAQGVMRYFMTTYPCHPARSAGGASKTRG